MAASKLMVDGADEMYAVWGRQPDPVGPAEIPDPVPIGRHPLGDHIRPEHDPGRVQLAMARVSVVVITDKRDGNCHA
jgi:hypothetical protein